VASLRTQKRRTRIRDNQQCQICGEVLPVPFGRIEVHHIIYCCNGGSDELENLATLCDLCHAVIHDHMGPAWVGLSKVPTEEREQRKQILKQAQEEFESYLRLQIEERRRIQNELWSQWGITRNV